MEDNGKRNAKKDGVDFLIKQGYKKLSAKTFINDADLELFLNKDFTNINKTRALGFIQILEREYDVDLTELRDAYLEHDNANKPKKPEKLFIEEPIIEKKPWQRYLPFIAGLLAVLGLAYYLLRPTVESVEPIMKVSEENKSIIQKAEKNIEKLEKNESEKVSKSALENSLESDNAKKEENSSAVADLSSVDDLDLDKVVLQMMKERNISSADEEEKDKNITQNVAEQNSSTKKVVKSETNSTESSKKVEKTAKKESKKPKKKLDKLANIPLAKTIPIEKFNKQQKKKSKKSKKATVGKGLFITPIQKAWVGVIYLDDFSKKDFLIRRKLPLNANRDQLIVVGHNKFKIYNKTYSVKFRAKGPVRFIYQDGELMEINKKEFMRTSAGVAW